MGSSQSTPKPVFSLWYPKLCHIMKCTPVPYLKPFKLGCQTILAFLGDELTADEWILIAHALSCDKSLHVICIKSNLIDCTFFDDVNSEEEARCMQIQFGFLWTAYILKLLTISISYSVRKTKVLTVLELDGIPIAPYLEDLLKALRRNKTVKYLSFVNCAIKDDGCETVCKYLRSIPNIEIINLSGCYLSSKSGEYLAKLIKSQRIGRFRGGWRYSQQIGSSKKKYLNGIKRITINNNVEFRNEGFQYILEELKDELGIKALDLQRCGVTEELTPIIISIARYNQSIEIIDLRQNDHMNENTINKIQQILQQKQYIGLQPEFQWCKSSNFTWNYVYSIPKAPVNPVVTFLIQCLIFGLNELIN